MDSRLDLPLVTLFCADCVDAPRAIRVLEHCQKLCRFGAVKFLTSLETDYPHETIVPLRSLNDYSAFMIKEAHKHIPTPYVLTVQHDGWVLHPDAWTDEFYAYDYIGPLYLQETRVTAESVGSGGFSFRSKALMQAVSELTSEWDGHNSWDRRDGKNFWGHEDGVISKSLRSPLVRRGFKFPTPLLAAHFAYGGNPNMAYYNPRPFGFHGFYAIDRVRGGPGNPISVCPDGTLVPIS